MKRPWTLVPLSQPTPAPAHETPEYTAEMEKLRARYAALPPELQQLFMRIMEHKGAAEWWHGRDE